MIGPGSNIQVYLACGVTDLRKGIDGLAALVQSGQRKKPRRSTRPGNGAKRLRSRRGLHSSCPAQVLRPDHQPAADYRRGAAADRRALRYQRRDCQDFGVRTDFYAITKRSSKRMANCALAMVHSLAGIFHSFAARFNTRKSSLMALSSVGKCPRVRTARRSLAFSDSMAFVV